jgi:hypothetical protein
MFITILCSNLNLIAPQSEPKTHPVRIATGPKEAQQPIYWVDDAESLLKSPPWRTFFWARPLILQEFIDKGSAASMTALFGA